MAKVWAVSSVLVEKDISWQAKLSRLLGLDSTIVDETVLVIFDTEEKAKDFIRDSVAMDHKRNIVRRERGIKAWDHELEFDKLQEGRGIVSYGDEDKEFNTRNTVYYRYDSYLVV